MVACLPGVDLQASVEGGDLAAFGRSDPRYEKILGTQDGAGEYLSKFQTPFGEALEPSLIGATERIEQVPSDWISEFRLLVTVPHVIRGRIDFAVSGLGAGPPYSELFDIYPFGLARGGEYITIQAPGETGLHLLAKFRGSYPFTVTANPKFFRPENDEELCTALVSLWQTTPSDDARRKFRSRIFRSLAMADYALRALYANFGSSIDVGIPLSLWTSAFQTLAAPPSGDVKVGHVVELVARVTWVDERLRAIEHEPVHFRPDPPGSEKVALPVQVYGRVHNLRNQLLHGRLLPTGLEPHRDPHWGNLSVQVPALYRCTLLHLLASKGFGAFPSEWFIQERFESALLGPSAGTGGSA